MGLDGAVEYEVDWDNGALAAHGRRELSESVGGKGYDDHWLGVLCGSWSLLMADLRERQDDGHRLQP